MVIAVSRKSEEKKNVPATGMACVHARVLLVPWSLWLHRWGPVATCCLANERTKCSFAKFDMPLVVSSFSWFAVVFFVHVPVAGVAPSI